MPRGGGAGQRQRRLTGTPRRSGVDRQQQQEDAGGVRRRRRPRPKRSGDGCRPKQRRRRGENESGSSDRGPRRRTGGGGAPRPRRRSDSGQACLRLGRLPLTPWFTGRARKRRTRNGDGGRSGCAASRNKRKLAEQKRMVRRGPAPGQQRGDRVGSAQLGRAPVQLEEQKRKIEEERKRVEEKRRKLEQAEAKQREEAHRLSSASPRSHSLT